MTLLFKSGDETVFQCETDASLPALPRIGEAVWLGDTLYRITDIQWDFGLNSRGGTIGRLYRQGEIVFVCHPEPKTP